MKIDTNKLGLAVGGFFGLLHACWALMVATGIAKPLMDWIFGLHFLNFQYSMNPFSFGIALMLVIVTAIIGYVTGVVLGWLWNIAHRAQ